MKKLLALALALLLSGCAAAPAPAETPPLPELEAPEWQAVTTDAASFGMTDSLDDPRFAYIFGHTDTVPLDQLIAFSLAADALSEGADDELRSRFLEAPHTVLAYLALMGDQVTELPGWEPAPTAELICQFIASADGAWHGGSEEFRQTLAVCREAYPQGRISHLLDVMEAELQASLERNQDQ